MSNNTSVPNSKSNLELFDFKGHSVRVVIAENGEPCWVASDVAKILGYSTTAAMTRTLDDEEKGVQNLHTPGGQQKFTVITESGLYSVILSSKRPESREFKRWVTGEVLPAIRRHGGYLTPAAAQEALTDPDFIIRLATALKEEQAKRRELEARTEQDTPKVLFADAVSTSSTTILVGDLAKILKGNGIEVGANRLFRWLRANGYLIARKGTDWNMPTQKAMELGLFKIKENTVLHPDGHVSVSKTPKVTGVGQEYFISRFLDGRLSTSE